MALSVKVGVKLKNIKEIQNEIQSQVDNLSKNLKLSPQKVTLGNVGNITAAIQKELDKVAKGLKLNLTGISIGKDIEKLSDNIKIKPKVDKQATIADIDSLLDQIKSKVNSELGDNAKIGKISLNTGSDGEFIGAKVTAQLENANNKILRFNQNLDLMGSTYNENSAKMEAMFAKQNTYLDNQITKLKTYQQAVNNSGGGSVSKQMELNSALQQQINKLEQLKNANNLLSNAEKSRITETTNMLRTQTNELTKYQSSFTNIFSKMLQYFGSGSVIYGFVNQVKQGVNEIIELDTAMRDLRKVADGTTEQLNNFTDTANEIAKSIDATTEGIIRSTEYYSKLGYAIEEATQRAEKANIFSNVSDMGIDEATKALITIQKGFNMSSIEDMNTIMDMTNEVGNKFSSSTEDIANGLEQFSSASYEAGNSLNESIGIFVAANASIQDANKVGNALKTITMRLRGMETDLDETGIPASKLRDAIKSLTAEAGQAVDIMKDDNTFKSTYEILTELAEVYPKLTDAQRSWLQYQVAGTRQGNILSGLFQNMSEGIDANTTALNSNGSAMRENEIYMDSAEAKINEFKETLKGIWVDTIDSEVIKGVVSAGTGLLNIVGSLINTFGAFPTVIGAVTAAMLTFNDSFRESFTNFTNMFTPVQNFTAKMTTLQTTLKANEQQIIRNINNTKAYAELNSIAGLSTNMFGLKLVGLNAKLLATRVGLVATKVATIALQAAMSFGLSLAIQGVISLFSSLANKSQELIDKNNELRNSFNSLENDTSSLEKSYEQYEELTKAMKDTSLSANDLKSKKSELKNITDSLIQQYPELKNALGNENLSYEQQLKAIQDVIKAKKEEQAMKAGEYFKENDISNYDDIEETVEKVKKQQEALAKYEKDASMSAKEYAKAYNTSEWDAKSQIKTAQAYMESYRSGLSDVKQQLQDIIMYESALDEVGSGNFTDNQIAKMQKALDSIQLYTLESDEANSSTKGNTNSLNSNADAYDNQANAVKDATTQLQEYANTVNGADWAGEESQPAEIYGKAIEEVQTLQGYIDDMNSETGYTGELVAELIQKYPEIGAHITDAAYVQDFLNKKIQEEVDLQNAAYEQMVGNDNEYYNSKIKNNEDYQAAVNEMLGLFVDNQGNAYNIDLSLYNNLNEAKTVALQRFGEGVNNFLRQFVDGNNKAYQIDVSNFNNLAQAKAQTISNLSALLVKLQNQTAIAFTEQANARNEMKAIANGNWKNGTGKNGTNQLNVFEGAKQQANEIAALQSKISELEQIGSGINLGGYTGSTFGGADFSGGGGSGSKGKSGSEKEGTYLEELYDRYSELQKAIDRCSNAYDLLEEKKKTASDKDKLNMIKQQIDLMNQQKDAVTNLTNEQQREYDELKSYLSGKGFNIGGNGEIYNYGRIEELRQWAGTNDERKEEVEAINDAIEEFNDLVQNEMPKSRKEFESLTSTVSDLKEEMEDIYREELELVTDTQKEVVDIIKHRLDKQKELLDQEYENEKKALEKTKKLYQDQNEEEDYFEELTEEQKKLDELKMSLVDLQRDVSGSSDAMIKDLEEQIKAQEKVIADKQKDYNRDKIEQSIDDKIQEIEDEKDAMDKQWKEQYSDANLVQMANEALQTGIINLNGEVVSLSDAMIEFQNETGEGNKYSPYVQKCA